MQLNAINEPAPLGSAEDNDAFEGDVKQAQDGEHYFVIQYMEAKAKDTAAAIREKCDQPDQFQLLPHAEGEALCARSVARALFSCGVFVCAARHYVYYHEYMHTCRCTFSSILLFSDPSAASL